MRIKPGSFAMTAVLAALSALPSLSIDMGLPAIPAIEATFADARGRGALILSLFLFGFALSPLIAGPIADRFGRRPSMLVGLALFSAAAAGCSLSPTFTSLLVFRLLQGVAAGACTVIPFAIVRDLFAGNEARIKMAQIIAVFSLAPMLAPILGGWVMATGNWHLISVVQASVGALILCTAAIGFTESLAVERRRSLRSAELVAGYRMILSNSAFRNFTLVYSFGSACMFAYISSSAAVVMGSLGLTEQEFSFMFAAISCGFMLGSTLSARLSKREIPSSRLLAAGLALMILASIVALGLAVTDQVHVLTIGPAVAVMIFSFGLIAPNATHEALQPLPQVAGAASGVSRCVQMATGGAASAVIAIFLPFGRPATVMTSLMTICAAAAVVIFAVQTRGKKAKRRPASG